VKGVIIMKSKIISIFIIILLLCSCSDSSVRFEPERFVDAGFTLNTGDYEIRGNVKALSYEDITFTFTYPEGLSYLTLKVTSEGYFTDVGGAKDEMLPDELPDNAPIKLFAQSIKTFLFEQNEYVKDDDGSVFTERLIFGETVKAVFDESGYIREISGENTVITFEAENGD